MQFASNLTKKTFIISTSHCIYPSVRDSSEASPHFTPSITPVCGRAVMHFVRHSVHLYRTNTSPFHIMQSQLLMCMIAYLSLNLLQPSHASALAILESHLSRSVWAGQSPILNEILLESAFLWKADLELWTYASSARYFRRNCLAVQTKCWQLKPAGLGFWPQYMVASEKFNRKLNGFCDAMIGQGLDFFRKFW